jgi:hypothetical protein
VGNLITWLFLFQTKSDRNSERIESNDAHIKNPFKHVVFLHPLHWVFKSLACSLPLSQYHSEDVLSSWMQRTMKMTQTSLPRIGLGMAALGRPGYINLDRDTIFGSDGRSLEKMQSQANLVLDALFRQSSSSEDIPWVDCARSYGLSEKFTGEYLRQNKINPNNVYVSSKWGYSKLVSSLLRVH